MPYFLSPVGNDQQCDANGNPLVGGKIYTYLAGTNTPAATFTDSTSGTQQANPIILNSLGLPASPIWQSGGIPLKYVIKDSADVLIRTIDNISGVNDSSSTVSEWTDSGFLPTYISGTQFSVQGDQTAIFQVNRRVRTKNTAGYVYGRVTASVYAANITTVTVLNDSGAIDAGISFVAYGFLSFSPSSIPYALYAGAGANTDITSLGALTAGGLPDNSVLTADIANAQVTPAKLSQPFTLGTAVATTSGSSIDLTSIPSWVNRVTLIFNSVSLNTNDYVILRLGAGSIDSSSYTAFLATVINTSSGVAAGFTDGIYCLNQQAGDGGTGSIVITRLSGNTWVWNGAFGCSGTSSRANIATGSKTLSGALDRIRLTSPPGTAAFDGGSWNYIYEG